MLAGVFIRLLLTILMTLSVHVASDAASALETKVDALFADFNQPGAPGASVMVIRDGNCLTLLWKWFTAITAVTVNVSGPQPAQHHDNVPVASRPLASRRR